MKSSMNHDEKMSSNNSTNWLAFSLSPHLKMELSSSPSVPTTYVMSSSPHLNYSPLCYAENPTDDFHYSAAPFAGMPLKSDGSLSIIEALSRSQPQGMACSTPKLEDFLGNAAMEAQQHHYQRNAPPLSLDSLYYTTATERQHPYSSYACIYQNALDGSRKPEEDAAAAFWAQNGLGQSNDVGGSSEAVGVVGCGGEIQSLSLSMSPGSQSSCVTAPSGQISPTGTEYAAAAAAVETSKKRGLEKVGQNQTIHRKSIDTFGQRTSQYRGVTRHRWTGRYEAHLWDNSCKKEGQTRKGRQVYLGGYDMEDKAARSYDLAALKYWGPSTHINFPVENYQKELEEMTNMTRQEYVAHLRRKSSGFSRGASVYRGVTRHHQHGRWQARIGRVAGNKDLYLGTFSTQEEAAEAYDVAAIKFRGVNAVTNFDITRYDVNRIISSNTLLSGELARRNKEILQSDTDAGPTKGMEPPLNLDRSIRDNDHLCLTKFGGAHFSNPSSLTTSSREESPERNGSGLKFGGSWLPSAAAMSMPHLPVFSAWANT